MDIQLLIGFLFAAVLCIATPGTDSIGTLSLGISKGTRLGQAFALGVGTGCLTHTLWATIGIAALVAASETLFNAIKYAGAGYLLYIGWQALMSKGTVSMEAASPDATDAAQPAIEQRHLFRQGFISNALNPKVMLFFIAFLPQFTNAEAGPIWIQMLVLGLIFSVMTGASYVLLAAFAGKIGRWLIRKPNAVTWMNRVTGLAFIGLAFALTMEDRR